MSPAAAPLATPEVAGRPCSIAAALALVGDRWSLLAVREIWFGNHRYSEIVRNTGAPRDRLAARLKALVGAGVLERREYSESPPRSDYHLTAAGRGLVPVLNSLREWGDRWAVERPPVTIRHHDHDLKTATICTVCGEQVRNRDTQRIVNTTERIVHTDAWTVSGPTIPTTESRRSR